MIQKKPREERCDVTDSEDQGDRQKLNPAYLAVAMGQANMTHARVLATILKDKKDNPNTHE